jgi:hypothetical protein
VNRADTAERVSGEDVFHKQIRPILEEYCFDCHADGANKGNVAFDEFKSDQAVLENHDLWWRALKNLRAGLMPPARKPQPSPEQKKQIEQWVKSAVFKSNPANPDPGRVTVRRLNRVEYRNTVRDLLGVDFDTAEEFPADDSGYGFDNIGDVLTLPPMLLEKYLAAAETIVAKAVPLVPAVPAEHRIRGQNFTGADNAGPSQSSKRNGRGSDALVLSYYEAASVTNRFEAEHGGKFELLLDFTANERYLENQFDYNKCRLLFKVDGYGVLEHEYTREGNKAFHYDFDQDWAPGAHEVVVEIEPLTPDKKQVRSLSIRLEGVTVRGPLDPRYLVPPKNHDRFFPKKVPAGVEERRVYAREILQPFVQKAYRRPVDSKTLERLVDLAEATWSQPGKAFEAGIGQAMVAVLASPRFLFREESPAVLSGSAPGRPGSYPFVDEYTLASRLSYFLWSSMPDAELLRLAGQHELRNQLNTQLARMLADPKAEALTRNFIGQWLQVRDIDTIEIDARQVLGRDSANRELDEGRQRLRALREKQDAGTTLTPEEKAEVDKLRTLVFGRPGKPPRAELNGELRRALRLETEKTFDYVLHQDRSLIELLDSDYTFLNERLASHYGLTNLNISGQEMRLVKLPPDSPRGGILTDGSVLIVTSNPTRTSPVKRGRFILDNLLGLPPAPPPPDIPPLEDAAKGVKDRKLTLRETLAIHRDHALCASCHNRMDPLGLALENFNALGMWRSEERGQPIDATGKLLTGEGFTNIVELKQILVRNHAQEFYRTLTEKLLIYALGRGLEYYDVDTVDGIVQQIQAADGRSSAWLNGIIESAPFQKTRAFTTAEKSQLPPPANEQAKTESRTKS